MRDNKFNINEMNVEIHDVDCYASSVFYDGYTSLLHVRAFWVKCDH